MKKRTLHLILATLLMLSLVLPAAVSAEGWDSPDLSWKKNTDPATFSLFFNMTWAPHYLSGSNHGHRP